MALEPGLADRKSFAGQNPWRISDASPMLTNDLSLLAPDHLRRTRVPKLSLPVRLALLVAGTTLPLIVFAAVIVFNNYEQDRKDASQRVLETARSIRLVLDAEIQRMTGGLQVLALTDTLRNGDFEGFRSIASGFPRSIWQGGRRAGGGPRRPPVVLLGHNGQRQPAFAQQPRNRGKGVCDQEPALLKSVRRRGARSDRS